MNIESNRTRTTLKTHHKSLLLLFLEIHRQMRIQIN